MQFKPQYAANGAFEGYFPAMCWKHHEVIEPSLGYCIGCLVEEVDPPDTGTGSFWWMRDRGLFCRCRHPRVVVANGNTRVCVLCSRYARPEG